METENFKHLYQGLFTALYDTTLCLPGTRKFSNSSFEAFSSPIRHELFNIVTRFDLQNYGSDKNTSLVQDVLKFYDSESTPLRWPVDSNSLISLEGRLKGAGFQQTGSVSKIAIRVPKSEITYSPSEDLDLNCVRISGTHWMNKWIEVFVAAFSLNGDFADGFSRWITLFNQTEQRDRFAHFLFLNGNEAIGTGSIFYHGVSAGVYNVALLPKHRKMGFGTEMINVLEKKISLSQANWILGTATPDGMQVYKKWKPICIEEVYYFDRNPRSS